MMNDNVEYEIAVAETDSSLTDDDLDSDRPNSAREVKRIFWANAIARCKKETSETGMTVMDWCIKNKLSVRSYWYYHKKIGDELAHKISDKGLIKKEPLSQTAFFPIEESSLMSQSDHKRPLVILHSGSAFIETKRRHIRCLPTSYIKGGVPCLRKGLALIRPTSLPAILI